jgi:hypothetical protein
MRPFLKQLHRKYLNNYFFWIKKEKETWRRQNLTGASRI